ncbi:MAG: cyclodeaminase/cyclohydrolase family protein [Candidatus Omnitrophica bacterium]|nr:cyclodeaminase/cyclohydrolase family protein [Candidatus Omnitrophota bacterium]MCM8808499.1 cyclodeaminase/cyclohydrolase family protein [Candidatus Omnitrophota bacterium]
MDFDFLENPLKNYIENLSEKTPVPGGGSASALLSCLSSSLLNMVLNYTIGKKGYEKYEDEMKKLREENEKIMKECLNFIEEDSKIYLKIDKNLREKKDCEEFLRESVFLHLKICENMLKVVNFCEIVAEKGNKNLISDTAISNIFAYSSFLSSKINILINLKFLKDKNFKSEIKEKLKKIEEEIRIKSQENHEKMVKKMEE